MKTSLVFCAAGISLTLAVSSLAQNTRAPQGRYASVNGLKMYYETHGSGQPLVLLHGAFGFNEGWATILPQLTKDHQVVAVELQGHGHTIDRDQPLNYEQMADDVAELLRQLKIRQADFFGYSMGGTVGLAVAIRHPELVRKLAVYGSSAGNPKDTYEPAVYAQYQSMSPENFAPPVLKDPYDRMAPDPKKWPVLVTKVKEMGRDFKGYQATDLNRIKAQVLIMAGDRDVVRPEHSVEMFRAIPNAQLAIMPGADHFVLFSTPDRILASLVPFLQGSLTPVAAPSGPK